LLTQISTKPDRSDMNTSRRPSGDSCGPSFLPLVAVTTVGVFLPGSPSNGRQYTPEERKIFCAAIWPLSLATVGCHVPGPAPAIRVAVPPFTGMVQRAGSPPLVEEKMTLAPCCDQVGGPMIAARSFVS